MTHLERLFDAPSGPEWLLFFLVLAGLGGLIGAGEFVRHAFRWSSEFTRKLVHVSVGILIFFAPEVFSSALPAILLAVIFIAVNFLAIRFGLLKGMHGANRPTYGTVYYPLAFLILVVVFWYRFPMIISLSILVLALGDAAAAIVGESIRNPRVYFLTADKKSFQGSTAMFFVSFLAMYFGISEYSGYIDEGKVALTAAIVAAVTATAWEALSSRGLDNLTIPLSVAFVLSCYLIPGLADAARFSLGAVLALVIAVAAWRLRALAPGGAVATFLLALVLFGTGGWKWTVPMLAFFVLSSILSQVGKQRKQPFEGLFEKSSVRDYGQVFANGGMAGAIAVLNLAFPSFDLYPAYLGSIAAVTADTWGTEIGLGSGRSPLLVTTWKLVEPGTNGGVTWRGLLAGVAGSAAIALTAFPWIEHAGVAAFVVAAGIGGSLIDSILGATVQAEYRCPVCGKVTERRMHCNMQPTHHQKGIEWMTNDVVNWACAIAGAGLVAILRGIFDVFGRT